MSIVELMPVNSQKSFYGKAQLIYCGRFVGLRSYDTIVMWYDREQDKICRCWHGYSMTTMKHIKAFMCYWGMPYADKKWWNALPVSEWVTL